MAETIKRKVLKISMLGDSTVGKTSIINSFLDIDFSNNMISNIGIDKIETSMKMKDGNEMKIAIWDTAGQERFHAIATTTIKNSQGIVISFDLTNRQSFENVERWLQDVQESNNKIPVVIFGNKCDIIDGRVITKEDVTDLLKGYNLPYFETSAKENINIKEGFRNIIEEAYQKACPRLGMDLKKNRKKKKGKNC